MCSGAVGLAQACERQRLKVADARTDSVPQVSRSEMHVGSCTAWSTASSLMARCRRTRPSGAAMMPSTPSSLRPAPASMCPAACFLTWRWAPPRTCPCNFLCLLGSCMPSAASCALWRGRHPQIHVLTSLTVVLSLAGSTRPSDKRLQNAFLCSPPSLTRSGPARTASCSTLVSAPQILRQATL